MPGVTLIRRRLGERIREFRRARGLSQEAFAERCELHRTYIGAIERGERNFTIDNLEKIAAALEVTVSDLLDFTGPTRDRRRHGVRRPPRTQ